MSVLNQKELISSLNIDKNIMFLLGAGCSISSGCMAANALIKEFKTLLYCRDNKVRRDDIADFYEKEFVKKLNENYPDKENNYSYYFEKCFPVAKDRNLFIKNNFIDKNPNLGYLCFANYVISNEIPYILTTNFDNLIEKSIRKLNDNYDFVTESDNNCSYLKCKTNILKLHGDYNYDHLHNTEEELKQLHNNMKESLKKIKVNKIVVIGYSGYDDSVMNALFDYMQNNPDTEILWCKTNKDTVSSHKILRLTNFNFNFVEIEGFDQLFNDYYKTYLNKNELIECQLQKRENEELTFLKPLNKIQNIVTNCYPIKKEPIVYEYDANGLNLELNCEGTLIRYKEKYYGYSKKYKALNNGVLLSSLKIPLKNKIELLKKYIIQSISDRNLKIYGNRIFHSNNLLPPFPCLKFDILIINNEYTLTLLPSYTFGRKPSQEEFSKINNKTSGLYSKHHNDLLNNLTKEYFGNLEFRFDEISFSFSNDPYSSSVNDNNSIEYTYIDEPKMVIQDQQSKNQIGLIQKIGPENIRFSPATIKIGVICCDDKKRLLWDKLLKELQNGCATNSTTDLIDKFPGFKALLNKSITFVKYEKYALKTNEIKSMNQNELLTYLLNWIKDYYDDKHIDIAIIFFNKEMEQFRKVGDIDFHDYIKFQCLNKYKTQIIEESTLFSLDDINKKLFNLALAIYTKTIGMPWKPLKFNKNNFYLGMSFGITEKGVHVGCSQLFDGAGRGMQLLVSPIENKNDRKNPYLTKEEAYNLGQKIRSIYYKSSKPFELDNITIHRTIPYQKQEIQGFKQAFEGLNGFNLIQIVESSDFNGYVKTIDGKIDGYPIRRGTVFKISSNEILVWTTGSVRDDEVMKNKTYRSSKRGIGSPILIRKFYGNDCIEKITEDLLKLTKMDMNSSDVLHSRLPVTLKYAKVLCDLIKQGELVDMEELINFQYVM